MGRILPTAKDTPVADTTVIPEKDSFTEGTLATGTLLIRDNLAEDSPMVDSPMGDSLAKANHIARERLAKDMLTLRVV